MNPRDQLPPIMPVEPAPETHHGIMARFRNYFLTGLVVAGPIAITFYLTWWFVTWVDGLVRPFVPIAYRPETYLPFGLPGSGLIVAVVALTLLGFLTANLIGRTLVDLGESLLGRLLRDHLGEFLPRPVIPHVSGIRLTHQCKPPYAPSYALRGAL